MTAAAVLAILVAAGETDDPATMAMVAAASEVVGADAVRLVSDAPLTDAATLDVEKARGARAVVRLEWLDAGHLHARLRLHAARTDRWIDREVAFAAGDGLAERGRALGFTTASMLPESDPTLRFAPAAAAEAAPPAPPEPPPGRTALGLAALGGTGIGGPADGWGAALSLERFVSDDVSLGGEAAARVGRVEALDARAIATSAALGAAWWPLSPVARGSDGGVSRWGVAVRLDALALYHLVTHTRLDGTSESKGQLVPGAKAGVEGTWRFARRGEAFLGAQAEIAFGTIDVDVVATDTTSARIPALRAVGELGIRARF